MTPITQYSHSKTQPSTHPVCQHVHSTSTSNPPLAKMPQEGTWNLHSLLSDHTTPACSNWPHGRDAYVIVFNLHVPTRSQNFASEWQTSRTLTNTYQRHSLSFRTECFYNALEWNGMWMEVRSTHPGLIPKILILYSIHPSFYSLLARWREHILGSKPWEDGKAPDGKRLEHLRYFVEHIVLHPTPATLNRVICTEE